MKQGKDYIYFNNSDIDKVLFIGCQDNKMKKYINLYKEIKDNKDTIKKTLQEIKEEKNEKWNFAIRDSSKSW